MTRRAWIGLGANLGDPLVSLQRAASWLSATPGVAVEALSPATVTAPLGPPQPRYTNAVARVRTSLAPRALLQVLQALERAARRQRGQRWGPRTLDLDLLLYDDRVVDSDELVLPHPRLHSRRFVLEPLAALDPDARHPRLDRSMADLLQALPA